MHHCLFALVPSQWLNALAGKAHTHLWSTVAAENSRKVASAAAGRRRRRHPLHTTTASSQICPPVGDRRCNSSSRSSCRTVLCPPLSRSVHHSLNWIISLLFPSTITTTTTTFCCCFSLARYAHTKRCRTYTPADTHLCLPSSSSTDLTELSSCRRMLPSLPGVALDKWSSVRAVVLLLQSN